MTNVIWHTRRRLFIGKHIAFFDKVKMIWFPFLLSVNYSHLLPFSTLRHITDAWVDKTKINWHISTIKNTIKRFSTKHVTHWKNKIRKYFQNFIASLKQLLDVSIVIINFLIKLKKHNSPNHIKTTVNIFFKLLPNNIQFFSHRSFLTFFSLNLSSLKSKNHKFGLWLFSMNWF